MALDLNQSPNHPDDLLLEEARMAASSDWEESFVADQLKRRAEWGGAFKLTDAQRSKLEEIAHGKDDDLFSRQPRWGKR
jgi:hypothetical protein